MPLLSTLTAPDNSILPNAVAVLSALATAAGIVSISDPLEAIPQFGLSYPAHKDRPTMDLALALTRAYGVRNASMGVVNLALWWSARQATGPAKVIWRHALGLAFVMNVATPIVDGILCESQGKTSGWKHWVFAPVTLAIGAGLLYQL